MKFEARFHSKLHVNSHTIEHWVLKTKLPNIIEEYF